ncbi:MAG: hypothetical protein JWO80_3710 [Bryobacterales bacterium]|nr:hypothetical protein [Bryobacterales bacterium]
MAISPLPTTLEQLGNRRFSFYPPILRVDRNEWLFQQATWSEMLVINAHSGQEVWIPRRFVGEVSRIEEPVLIVGLLKEVEYRDGTVWPHRRRVIQMPVAVGAESTITENVAAPRSRSGPAAVVQISLHSAEDTRKARTFVGAVVIGVLGVLVIAGVVGESQMRPRRAAARNVSYKELRPGDDASLVQRLLGPSISQEWHPETGQLHLAYPQLGYIVVLTGRSRDEARYSGVVPFRSNPRF